MVAIINMQVLIYRHSCEPIVAGVMMTTDQWAFCNGVVSVNSGIIKYIQFLGSVTRSGTIWNVIALSSGEVRGFVL